MKLFLVLIFALIAIGLGQVPDDEPDTTDLKQIKERIKESQLKLLCRRNKDKFAKRLWKCVEKVEPEIRNIFVSCCSDCPALGNEGNIKHIIDETCEKNQRAKYVNQILDCTSHKSRTDEDIKVKLLIHYQSVSELLHCLERVFEFPLAPEDISEN